MSEHKRGIDKHDSYDHGERLQRNMPAWKQREITEHDHKRANLNDKLPYELTEGVIATWKGLLFSDSVEPVWLGPYEYTQHTFGLARAIQALCHTQLIADGNNGSLWKWSNAVGCLRYREGEPWCTVNELINELGEMYECIATFTGKFYTEQAALSDIANMLIRGNTDAFRVLHACIKEFGDG